jgi:hypothetical protein
MVPVTDPDEGVQAFHTVQEMGPAKAAGDAAMVNRVRRRQSLRFSMDPPQKLIFVEGPEKMEQFLFQKARERFVGAGILIVVWGPSR